MTPRSRHALESFTQQLHAWRPFANAKRPCRSDRSTAPDALDLSRLSLLDSPPTPTFLRKRRRRRPSRSLSARSSRATASDFPAAPNTDSSGEMFVNAGWGSDASEATTPAPVPMVTRGVEREGAVPVEAQGFESGYGSEPGYRGDAEFGYGDEFDEEDDDGRVMFWGGGPDHMEIVGENTFAEQKTHPRCRRKKQEWRILSPLR